MKYILFLFLIIGNVSYGQKSLVKGNTYAVIVGISSYADDDIPDLRYAHKDAEEFRNYLLSEAGGTVPLDQIKYLANDDATISNVYTAMKWLEDRVQKNDLVYFYFSGHGDIEKGLYKLGFLIAHDTPNLNYINNAIRIEDVNIMANNLSATKDADVVMITDACHSGKLSGTDNTRSLSLGDLLTKVEDNEIRIASCEPNQLSKEDAAWGGGRGVFSFYLINGLKGLADQDGNNNKEVTIGELKDYLSTNVKRDVKRLKRAKQTPVIKAKSDKKKVAFVNNEIFAALGGVSSDDSQASMGGDRSIGGGMSAQDAYFKELSRNDLKFSIDFREWSNLSNDEIIDEALLRFNFDHLQEIEGSTWSTDIRTNILMRNSYKQQLASAIHNEVQKTINAYLIGDKDEMEKRKYYNVHKSDFDEYVFMLEVAMKLISPNDYLYHMLEVKKHYFAGIAARLKVGYSANTDSLINVGMSEQEKALKLDNKAAYIHNEIGLLYRLKRDNESAIIKFNKAKEIAPSWAIPVSNLGNAYLSQEKYNMGFEMAKKAVEMQPDYVNAKISLGRNAAKLKNYLLAEDMFLKAANLNSMSYESREELGSLYTNTIRYEDANYYYQEAAVIRRGIDFPLSFPMMVGTDADAVRVITDATTTEAFSSISIMDSTRLSQNPILHFEYAMNSYGNKDFNTALRYLKKTIILSKSDPLAYFYMGNIHMERNNRVAAEICYKKAIENYMNTEEITSYLNSLNSFGRTGRGKKIYFRNSYDIDRVYFNLSKIYRVMNYNVQAEDMYRKLINSYISSSKEPLLFYRLLWELKEENGSFMEVESLMNEYRSFNPINGLDELYSFYFNWSHFDIGPNNYEYKMALLGYEKFKSIKKEKVWSRYYFADSSEDELLDEEINNTIKYPVMDTTINYANSADLGTKETIFHFEQVGSESDSLLLLDVYTKLAELYKDIDNMVASKKYNELALEYGSWNASVVEDLTEIRILNKECQSAYEMLLRAYRKKELYYDDMVTLVEFAMLAGDNKQGDAVNDRMQKILPNNDERLIKAKALKHLLEEEYETALSHYQGIYTGGDTNNDITYTISRLHAQQGDLVEAEKFLSEVERNGFNLYWVLKNDPMMKGMKNTETYQSILVNNEPELE